MEVRRRRFARVGYWARCTKTGRRRLSAVDLFAFHPVHFPLELEFVPGREVLDLVIEVVRTRKSLTVLRHLTPRKEPDCAEGQNREESADKPAVSNIFTFHL